MATQPPPLPPGFRPAQSSTPQAPQPRLVPLGGPDPARIAAEERAAAADVRAGRADERAAAAEGRAVAAATTRQYRQIPTGLITRTEAMVNAIDAFERAGQGFDPEFSGAGSGWENTGQEWFSSIGTPGQRDWWADFRSTDVVLRNALFGASLTDSEKASYAQTTITPNMDPAVIRQNLERRRVLARAVLARRARLLRAGPFDPEMVDALIGGYDQAPGQAPASGQPGIQPPGALSPAGAVVPDPTGPVPGGEQFSAQLETALRSGQFTTPAEMFAFVERINPTIASRLNAETRAEMADTLARFNEARGRGQSPGIAVDVPMQPPPNIADVRGAEANPNALMLNEAVRNATPGFGPLFRAATGMLGQEGGDAFHRGFNDVPTFGFSDEIGAGIQAGLGQGNFDDNLARERSINNYDYENNFGARLGGQLAGGLTMPFNPAASLGRQVATVGAQGALYGFGSGEGANRVPNAVLGGTVGAAIPPLLRAGGAAISALRGRPALITSEGQNIARAAEEEGVQISRPIVDPTSRDHMAYLESSMGSGRPVRESIEATERGIDARAGQLAAGGTASERGTMGQRIQTAADRGHTQAGTAARRVYDRADEAAEAAGAPGVRASETVAHLDSEITRLQRNPKNNAAIISYLQTVRGDFVDDAGNLIPKSIADIRDIRTGLSGEINRLNLSMTSAERIVNQAITAANADVARDFGSAAPQALRLYNRADRMWRARAENRTQIIERLIGPDNNRISGGAVMDRVAALGKGDTPRLRRMWAMLTPEERLDTAATIASAAGRRAPDEAFSAPQFIAWARNIPDSARAVMFGADGAKSIENLNTLSRALIDTRGALNNSRSGMVANWRGFLRDFTSGGLPGAAVGAIGGGGVVATGAAGMALGAAVTGGGLIARRLSARSLMSPDMTRWLAAAPRMTTPQAIRSHVGRLSTIASRNPALAQEATGLRRALLQGLNDNAPQTGRAAASPDEGPDRQQ